MLLLLIDCIKQRKDEFKKVNKISLSFSIAIALSEVAFVYWQIGGQLLQRSYFNFPQMGSFKEGVLHNLVKLKLIPTILLSSYIPIPNININFWNTNLLVNLLSKTSFIIAAAAALLLLVLSILLLNKKLKVIFLINMVVMLGFMAFIYTGFLRHWGHIFITFFTCLWLSKTEEEKSSFYTLKSRKLLLDIFVIIILACSLVGSVTAFYYDYKFPFSDGENVARYLKKNYDLDNTVIIGYKNYTTETVAGYLSKDFYYPETKDFRTINVLDWKNYGRVNPDLVLLEAIKLKLQNLNKEILIINDNESELLYNYNFNKNFKLDKDFSNAIVSDENFSLNSFKSNLNFEILKEIDASNFKESWKNLKGCEFQTTNDNKTLIKVLGDDPNFESNFSLTIEPENEKLLVEIDIETSRDANLTIYYKRTNSQYNEKDKSMVKLSSGLNNVAIVIDNINKLESIRLDPVDLKTDCTIDKVEIYRIIQK